MGGDLEMVGSVVLEGGWRGGRGGGGAGARGGLEGTKGLQS